ncbi:MAG: S8 family serine peptidase, partial [Candidatus Thermoplasmatota archaeon]|nr:S8 family serine peptidase [Candidatus Thermoplasmatota archaeon]
KKDDPKNYDLDNLPSPDPNHRKIVHYWTYEDDHDLDSSGHGTHVAGSIAGNATPYSSTAADYNGNAPRAKLSFVDIGGDGDSLAIPSDLNYLFSWHQNDGAYFASNSWGSTSSSYSAHAKNVDNFMWDNPSFLVLFANGNDGSSANTVGEPATAKSAISVGALGDDGFGGGGETLEDIASFSSRGPTDDGRLKPTVVSPGVAIDSADSDGDLTTDNSGITSMQGTSMACPNLAGAMGLVRQYFTEGWYPTGSQVSENAFIPSGALMKSVAVNSADQATGSGSSDHNYDGMDFPNNDQGFGRVHLNNSLFFSGDARDLFVYDNGLDKERGLTTGETWKRDIDVSSNSEDLKISLAWSDYPGTPGVQPNLVNDLNLKVTAPDGTTYHGNKFSGSVGSAFSVENPSTYDDLNPVEEVWVDSPQTGTWTIETVGYNCPVAQPFAMTVTGDLGTNTGKVSFDRNVYGENGTASIRVEDLDESTSVDVTVSSDRGDSETVTLSEAGSNVFTGSIELSTTDSSGVLHVADGDQIYATYGTLEANAYIDGSFPAIENITVNALDNSAQINWMTADHTNYTFEYGSKKTLGNKTRNAEFKNGTHKVNVKNLEINTTYYFRISAWDRVGHKASTDILSFTTNPRADVLLVDDSSGSMSWIDYEKEDLEKKGWRYSIWDVPEEGQPTQSYLENYKAVVWDTSDGYPPLNDSDVDNVLRPYLDNGGKLMMIGQDIGWAAFDSSWSSTNLQDFCNNYLHFDYVGDQVDTAPLGLTGVGGDPVGDGINDNLVDNLGGFYPEEVTNSGGTVAANYGTGDPAVIRHDSGTYRDIYVSYAYQDHESDAERGQFMNQSITWLLGNNHAPKNEVTYPNGGETLSGTVTITWNASDDNAVAYSDVYYSNNSGKSWNYIDTTTGTSLDWDTNSVPQGDNYKVSVITYDDAGLSVKDSSDDVFSISGGAPSVNITAPTENTIMSGNYDIEWSALDSQDGSTLDIKIEYSPDGGTSWTTLEDGNDNNDGTYTWDTTTVSDGVNYKIRVIATDSDSNTGSDITPPVSVDNNIDDRWYFQAETPTETGLSMYPVEENPGEVAISIPSSGNYSLGNWSTDQFSSDTDINGEWNFSAYSYTSETGSWEGYLKAKLKDDSDTVIHETVTDDENIADYGSYHRFNWSDTVSGTVPADNNLTVELVVEAISAGSTQYDDNVTTGETSTTGTVINDHTSTHASNNTYEEISEESFGGSTTVIDQGFESGLPSDWSHAPWDYRFDNTNDSWGVGSPSGGGPSAHGGSNVAAVNITGDYVNEEGSYLETPSVDIPSSVNNATFSFWLWTDIEDNYDGLNLKLSQDGGTYQNITANSGYDGTISSSYDNPLGGEDAWWALADGTWTNVTVNLTSYAGSSVQIRWHWGSDSINSLWGPAIDDVWMHLSGGEETSKLEHEWTFDIPSYPGESVDFYAEAHHTSNTENDDFNFSYSTDGSTFNHMFTVTKTSDDDSYQTYSLPDSTSGTVYVKATDTDHTGGNTNLDTIYIDHMFIRSYSASTPKVYFGFDHETTDSYVEPAFGESYNTAPSVDLTRPDGGENFIVNSTETIWWNMSDSEDANTDLTVDLYYSNDSGSNWNVIDSSLTGTSDPNSYDWTVPNDTSKNCLVRADVTDTNGSTSTDQSTDTFTIDLYDLNITSTAGGNVTEPGEGIFSYPSGELVDLEAVADLNYTFVGWTGDTGDIDSTQANSTTLTMKGNYDITANFSENVTTFDIDLYASGESDGWNFVSFPLISDDTSLLGIIEDPDNGITGNYNKLMYYEAKNDRWRTYVPGRADHYNDLETWNHTMGVWINMNQDDILTITGDEPGSSTLNLQPGWNMVGLPINSSDSGSNLNIPTEVSQVGYFEGSQDNNLNYTADVANFQFEPGKGYWLYNDGNSEVKWTVDY